MCLKRTCEQTRNSHHNNNNNMADEEDLSEEESGNNGVQGQHSHGLVGYHHQQQGGPSTLGSTATVNPNNGNGTSSSGVHNSALAGSSQQQGGYPINTLPSSPPGNSGVGRYLEEEVGFDDEDGSVTVVSLPKALIVTGVDDGIFEDVDAKDEFENLFKAFDDEAFVQYLKCFRRARVVFSSALLAAKARIHLHETELGGKTLKCYFAQPTKCLGSQAHLEPPKPVRQHLISPPASPPVGWEPTLESDPVINYDLLAAVANLSPGEAHELHPPTEDQPGVVVHVCEDPEGFRGSSVPGATAKPRIVQTKCPDRVN